MRSACASKSLLFLKKKKQKDFPQGLRPWWRGRSPVEKFFGSFFQKRTLPFLPF
jgi:hypothetical protein